MPSGSIGRRLLTGLSSNRLLSAWKDLLREKTNKLGSNVERACSSIDPNFFRSKAGAGSAAKQRLFPLGSATTTSFPDINSDRTLSCSNNRSQGFLPLLEKHCVILFLTSRKIVSCKYIVANINSRGMRANNHTAVVTRFWSCHERGEGMSPDLPVPCEGLASQTTSSSDRAI